MGMSSGLRGLRVIKEAKTFETLILIIRCRYIADIAPRICCVLLILFLYNATYDKIILLSCMLYHIP